MTDASSLVLGEESFRIRGAIFEVHRAKGAGFLEPVYRECLAIEFAARGVPFEATPRLRLEYKGTALRATYSPDFVCYGKIIVELKAVRHLLAEHRAQLLNYLKATGLELGFLVNFGDPARAIAERLVLQDSKPRIDAD